MIFLLVESLAFILITTDHDQGGVAEGWGGCSNFIT